MWDERYDLLWIIYNKSGNSYIITLVGIDQYSAQYITQDPSERPKHDIILINPNDLFIVE